MTNREQFLQWWKDFDPHENYYTQEKSCAWASWKASAELSAGRIAELEAQVARLQEVKIELECRMKEMRKEQVGEKC